MKLHVCIFSYPEIIVSQVGRLSSCFIVIKVKVLVLQLMFKLNSVT